VCLRGCVCVFGVYTCYGIVGPKSPSERADLRTLLLLLALVFSSAQAFPSRGVLQTLNSRILLQTVAALSPL
jgi:hypothetical protein